MLSYGFVCDNVVVSTRLEWCTYLLHHFFFSEAAVFHFISSTPFITASSFLALHYIGKVLLTACEGCSQYLICDAMSCNKWSSLLLLRLFHWWFSPVIVPVYPVVKHLLCSYSQCLGIFDQTPVALLYLLTITDIGVANPQSLGQAIIKTATALIKPIKSTHCSGPNCQIKSKYQTLNYYRNKPAILSTVFWHGLSGRLSHRSPFVQFVNAA
jgi:hypothetical protein